MHSLAWPFRFHHLDGAFAFLIGSQTSFVIALKSIH
ncbi:hypothetical protein ACUXQ2_002892 [Cupriavidus metallidurans]